MNKKIFLLFWILLGASMLRAQVNTMAAITPPSPGAIALSRTDFSDVNLYTGKVNYSLPLYTIKERGFSFPITLNYIGGNGIRVSEVASSVGLGWNLTYTGLVTRSIRGIADDQYAGDYKGYIHLPNFPSQFDPAYREMYENMYGTNRYDAQPDEFTLSVAGMSVSFYINKLKKPVYVEKTDLIVKPIFTDYTITSFEVTATDGKIYYFTDTEDNRTITPGAVYETYDYSNTSWYLTKVVSEHGVELVHFYYSPKTDYYSQQPITAPYQYQMFSANFNETETSNVLMYVRKPILQRIEFSDGQVEFKMGTAYRLDLHGDKYIDSVIVKKTNGEAIKKFHFNYSYFTGSGVVPDGTVMTLGSTDVRLKLDGLTEISALGQKRDYTFEYNQDTYLPDRNLSFAQDHWGYSNGKSNTTFEAKHRVKYYTQSTIPFGSIDTLIGEFGTADREPDINYAKAGVLQKVNLPTGGNIQYAYELHSSADARLPNTISQTTNSFTLDELPNSFTVAMLKEPFGNVKVQALTGAGSSIIYSLYHSTDVYMYSPIYTDTITGSHTQRTFKLQNGSYLLKAKIDVAHPDPSFNYGPLLKVETETSSGNKPVGGLRIKTITLNDPVTTGSYTRNYYYNENGDNGSSASTGTIANAPQYGVQRIMIFSSTYIDSAFSLPIFVPEGYARQLTSQYPLSVTQASNVGYSKVTVVDGNDLKTAYMFTSFKDFLETSDGYRNSSNDSFTNIGGTLFETFPNGPYDDRDFLRGKPTQTIWYKKTGSSTFEKIKKQENTYGFNMGMKLRRPNNTLLVVLPDTSEVMEGKIFSTIFGSYVVYKSYRLYTGKYDLVKTVDTLYEGSGFSATKTEYEYGDSPTYRDSVFHYQPTKITRTTSNGTILTDKLYYPYNWRLSLAEWNTGDIAILKLLENKNRVGSPIIKQSERDGIMTAKLRNDYDEYTLSTGNILGLKTVKTWNTITAAYEPRISINRYDRYGNVLEQQKLRDVPSSYLYSYKGQYPIAEIKNASYASLETLLGATTIATFSTSVPTGKSTIDGFLSPIKTSLPSAYFSSYVYSPLVGLSSQTDVKGMPTYYEYDDYQRLLNLKDRNEDIVKNYQYHYASDLTYSKNTVQSQSFTKNDCGSGFTGSSVTYTVPANTYSSAIDVAHANTLALADIAANGQAYANANGTCTSSSISVTYSNTTKKVSGVSSGNVTSLLFKNSGGTTIYTFNQTQLLAGITIAPGTYTLEFTITGSAYDSGTQLGWGAVSVVVPSTIYSFNNTGASGGVYTITGANFSGNSSINLGKFAIE